MIRRAYFAAKHWLDARVPHYVVHMGVGCAIGAGLTCAGIGSPIAGAAFYLGRELRDWEKSCGFAPGGFAWRDFLWPTVPCVVAELAIRWA